MSSFPRGTIANFTFAPLPFLSSLFSDTSAVRTTTLDRSSIRTTHTLRTTSVRARKSRTAHIFRVHSGPLGSRPASSSSPLLAYVRSCDKENLVPLIMIPGRAGFLAGRLVLLPSVLKADGNGKRPRCCTEILRPARPTPISFDEQ